jgi:hypothetical protein
MQFFLNYLIVLSWAIVIAIVMAVSYGISIWILDKMLMEVKNLRHLTKKPIAMSIVLGSFILGVAIIIASLK